MTHPHGARFRLSTVRRQADGMNHTSRKIEPEPGETVDEFVLDRWLHVERMDTSDWHVAIGDARISVRVVHGRMPLVDIERGEYGPVHGETRLPRTIEQRHDPEAKALVYAWNKLIRQFAPAPVRVEIDGFGIDTVVGAYLEGGVGHESAVLIFQSGLRGDAVNYQPIGSVVVVDDIRRETAAGARGALPASGNETREERGRAKPDAPRGSEGTPEDASRTTGRDRS